MKVTWIILDLVTLKFICNDKGEKEYYTLNSAHHKAIELKLSRYLLIDVTQETGLSIPFPPHFYYHNAETISKPYR